MLILTRIVSQVQYLFIYSARDGLRGRYKNHSIDFNHIYRFYLFFRISKYVLSVDDRRQY